MKIKNCFAHAFRIFGVFSFGKEEEKDEVRVRERLVGLFDPSLPASSLWFNGSPSKTKTNKFG